MADTEASKVARTVPGAPPPSSGATSSSKKKSKAKKKQQQQQSTPAQPAAAAPTSSDSPITATTSALLSSTPSATEVDTLLLGSLSEARTEQAQHEATLSPAAAYLSKRTKVLTKKLQRIATYDAKTLNVDQQRAISSKDALEMSVAELTEARESIASAEREKEESREKDALRRLESVRVETETKTKQSLLLLLRFFKLNSYFDPAGNPPSFAPRPLPAALEEVDANTVHAIRQLYAVLTLTHADGGEDREERRQKAESELERFSNKEQGEVVAQSGVSYAQIHALIEALEAPHSNGTDAATTQEAPSSSSPTEAQANALPAFGDIQPDTFTAPSSPPETEPAAAAQLDVPTPAAAAATAEPTVPASTSTAEPAATEAATSFLPIRFMQEDEVETPPLDEAPAPAPVEPEEQQQQGESSSFQPFSEDATPCFTPVGGEQTPDAAPEEEKDVQSGGVEAQVHEKEAVSEAEASATQAPATTEQVEEKKEDKFNWADDVEDEEEASSTAAIAAAATSAPSTAAAPQASVTPSATQPIQPASAAQSKPTPAAAPPTEAQVQAQAARRAALEAQRRAEAIAAAKAARIDEEGFEKVAPRKVKLPTQQQQGQGQRGGRGGAGAGAYGRGAMQGQGQGARGRGGLQQQQQQGGGRGAFSQGYAQQGYGQQQQQQQQPYQQQNQGANRGRGGKAEGGASRGGFADGQQRGRGGGGAGRGRGRGTTNGQAAPAPPSGGA